MKLTWFGGSTFRIHIGGQIIVTDAALAAAPADVTELRSGADLEVGLGTGLGDLPAIDVASWRPPRPGSVLEESEATEGLLVRRIEGQGLLLYATGEAPLLLIGGGSPGIGRWSRDAVVVLYGGAAEQAGDLLEKLEPKLLLLAASEPQVEVLFAGLQARLGETALVALEPGMALEA